jgi:DDE superfamily endonuclease
MSATLESCSRSSAFPPSARGLATPRKTSGSSRLSKKLPARLERSSRWPAGDDADRDLVPEPALGLDPGDEARIGQKNGRVRQWARCGTRPRQPADQRYESAYLFGAICPARGVGAALALPFADTEAMQLHLDEISRHVADGAHAVLLLDRAGWHTTAKLDVPSNVTPIFLPSRAPELNPVENIWQYLRANWLSNRVFETYDAIIEAACDAWLKLVAQPATIKSIGMRDWAHVDQTS